MVGPVLEIRTYRLVPGSTAAFARVMRDESLPLLKAAGIEVVYFGASLVLDDHPDADALLMRRFVDLATRDKEEEAFYGSDPWRHGPRERVLACIETFHTVVLDAAAWPSL